MWLFVFFDLPTNTKKERRTASGFRKILLLDGFTMMQYSVYIRHCPSKQNADVHIKRVKSNMHGKGHISILQITDKQYSNITNYWGKTIKKLPKRSVQSELF